MINLSLTLCNGWHLDQTISLSQSCPNLYNGKDTMTPQKTNNLGYSHAPDHYMDRAHKAIIRRLLLHQVSCNPEAYII